MAASDNIFLSILTPEKTLVEVNVEKVTLPGAKGRFMVLQSHAPVITSLEEGDVVYVSAGVESRVHVVCGFAEVNNDKVIVCAEV